MNKTGLETVFTEFFVKDNRNYKITARVRLSCTAKSNGHSEFAVTGELFVKGKRGYEFERGGCIHEIILEHFPELKPFVDLHLCDERGMPFMNGDYNIPGLTDNEREAIDLGDDQAYKKYMLYYLGIISRQEIAAQSARKQLEKITGDTWANPLEPGERRYWYDLTEEQKNEVTERIKSGYYTPERIAERAAARRQAALDKERAEIIRRRDAEIKEAQDRTRIMRYILDYGLSVNNVIYYPSTNKVVFNWKDWDDKITQEQFVDFLNSVDYSELPEDITFEIK